MPQRPGLSVVSSSAPKPAYDAHRNYIPDPKNKKFFVAVLVGAPADIAREVKTKLAEKRNVHVKYHMEYKKPRQLGKPLPHDIDFVLIARDMLGHADESVVVKKAKALNIPIIRTRVKSWSHMAAALDNRGIKTSPEKIDFADKRADVQQIDKEEELTVVEEIKNVISEPLTKLADVLPFTPPVIQPIEHSEVDLRRAQIHAGLAPYLRLLVPAKVKAIIITSGELQIQYTDD